MQYKVPVIIQPGELSKPEVRTLILSEFAFFISTQSASNFYQRYIELQWSRYYSFQLLI